MWPFSKQAKLLRQLGHLAFYSDKGIDYSRHSPDRVKAERASGLAKIRKLVAVLGPESLPPEFLEAVASGNVATDLTGQYIDVLKAHFGGGAAP